MELLSPTRLELLYAIRRRGKATVDELVDELKLSKTALRAHLLTLEERRFIERTEAPADDGPGRPPLTYRVSREGAALFPSDDQELLTRLLRFLDQRGHEELLRDFFGEIWRQRRQEYENELRARHRAEEPPLELRLVALEAVLQRSHFMPQVALEELQSDDDEAPGTGGGGRRLELCEYHCPLPAAVRATRIPCELETAFLSEIVGARPKEVVFSREPHSPCRFSFVLGEAKPSSRR